MERPRFFSNKPPREPLPQRTADLNHPLRRFNRRIHPAYGIGVAVAGTGGAITEVAVKAGTKLEQFGLSTSCMAVAVLGIISAYASSDDRRYFRQVGRDRQTS